MCFGFGFGLSLRLLIEIEFPFVGFPKTDHSSGLATDRVDQTVQSVADKSETDMTLLAIVFAVVQQDQRRVPFV